MKNLKKVSILLFLFAALGLTACGDKASLDFDELESRIEDRLPEDPAVEGQNFCAGEVATQSGRLNVRTSPEVADNICARLEKGTPVLVSINGRENGFLRIETTLCGEDFDWVYVSDRFIEMEPNCLVTDVDENNDDDDQNNNNNEGDDDEGNNTNPIVEAITDLGRFIVNELSRVSTRRRVTRTGPTGNVEVFKLPGSGTESICGSKHIRSNRSAPYLAKDTLCAWTAVTQEWANTECPAGNSHCRIMLGDATFGERQPSSWPHSTHRRGWCMDIWPMRKEGCGERELTWRSSCYDHDATQKFVRLLIKHGADRGNQFFFNDPEISETRRLSNHDDHIHVCFKPSNSTVSRACDNIEVDRNVCGEF